MNGTADLGRSIEAGGDSPVQLEEWRLHRNLTQRDLAARAQVALTTINEVETGKRKARPTTLSRIAAALGTDEQSLFSPPDASHAQVPQLVNIADLLAPANPRTVVVTQRRWMEPYHSLEEGELGHRLEAAREHSYAFDLWLRALALYRSSFDGVFDWGNDLSIEAIRGLNLRGDLLGLAGSSSKPALDALLAGYYWAAFGLIRGLLETWRRVAYIRLRPGEAPAWFELPNESPVGPDGQPRKDRKRPLPFNLIDEAIRSSGSDEDTFVFGLVNAGIAHCHGGAHPSAEGMMQLWSTDDGRRIFGPNYSRPLCAFGLKWGLFAHLVLLREVNLLRPQGADWISDYNEAADRYGSWQRIYNEEFVGDDLEDSEPEGSATNDG